MGSDMPAIMPRNRSRRNARDPMEGALIGLRRPYRALSAVNRAGSKNSRLPEWPGMVHVSLFYNMSPVATLRPPGRLREEKGGDRRARGSRDGGRRGAAAHIRDHRAARRRRRRHGAPAAERRACRSPPAPSLRPTCRSCSRRSARCSRRTWSRSRAGSTDRSSPPISRKARTSRPERCCSKSIRGRIEAALAQAQAAKQKDEASLASAQADLARASQLDRQGYKSQQSYDQAKAQVGQLQAAIKGDEAQIETAKLNLSYATIKAPIDGRLGARLVDAGNMVRASEAPRS